MNSLRYHTSHLERLPLDSMQLSKDRFKHKLDPSISHIAKKKKCSDLDHVIQKK